MRGFDPRLFRLLATGLAAGVAAGMATLAGLLWTDVGGLGAKALGGRHGWLPLAMLVWAFAITFGSAGMGIAIHRLGRAGADARRADAVPRARSWSGARDDRRASA